MKKLWLLIAINQFQNPKEVPLDAPMRMGIRGAQGRARQAAPEPEDDATRLSCYVFNSLPELEERSQVLLRQNSNLKFMVFEAKSVIEIPPVDPICKEFDANGQLLA